MIQKNINFNTKNISDPILVRENDIVALDALIITK